MISLRPGNRFWTLLTGVILLVTAFVVVRNAVHAVKIKRQIARLMRQREEYRAKIERDSTLTERLRYEDYLEEYAREHFRMQRRDEQVYVLEE